MTVVKVYLPKTADNYARAHAKTRRALAGEFGGFTAYDGVGGWIDGDGELVEEPVTVVETITEEGAPYARGYVGQLALETKDLTGEAALMYVIDGDKFMA